VLSSTAWAVLIMPSGRIQGQRRIMGASRSCAAGPFKVVIVPRTETSSLIGAVLGLVYVLVNASKLPDDPAVVLRILSILGLVAVYLAVRKLPADDSEPVMAASRARAETRRVTVIAAVFALLGTGFIAGPLHHEEATVAWLSLIFGLYCVSVARVWRHPALRALGTGIAACGLVGLVLAFAGMPDESVAIFGGILPAALLLAAAWRQALRART
jgi:hypothetical protein